MIKRDYIKIKLSDLKSYEKNNKKHWENVDEIVKSIQANTYIAPIIIDENNVILAGHGRKLALDKLQVSEAEVLQVSGLSEEQKRDFRIRDNKLTELSEWDFENIKFELDDLDIPDLSDLFKDEEELQEEEVEAKEDDYEIPDTITTDIVLWDLFEIGEHRLLCGDSTDSDQVAKLMNGEKADMVFTDPPYGVAINNSNGKILGDEDLQVFDECLPNIELFSKEDSHIYIYFGVQFISECISKIKEYFKQTNILIQRITHENKPSPKGYFKNNYEVCYFSNRRGKDFNSGILEVSESTKNDSRYNGDGFLNTYLALNEIKSTEHNAKSIHPTQKTIEICSFYQKVSSNVDDLILDLFLGSGSTMVASHQLKRKCYGMELDPKYCQVIIDRMIRLDPELTIKKNWAERDHTTGDYTLLNK